MSLGDMDENILATLSPRAKLAATQLALRSHGHTLKYYTVAKMSDPQQRTMWMTIRALRV